MINLQQVTKKFGRFSALKDCNVSIESGKVIGVVGENGSGKSTMLRLLAGSLRPTHGKVMIDGAVVTRKISEKLAYLTDNNYFYPYFTIQQLIDFYHSQFNDFDRNKAQQLLHFMELDSSTKIKHLSKGNVGRIKIVITLSRNAPYLVLDEPFSGLDPMVRKSIITSMIRFVDLSQQTLILTTHEINEIEPILDEVILLGSGEVVAQRSVEAIRDKYQMSVVDWMESNY
ncbi:ABC transporter ATP-binding protein [Aquibacillus sediminis]|uniref:ABC transporter ATP-binding protein n=1 Tax=Aquibacillus sediminis TaxID=2574734 RepID=UPI001108497A|nr:ABC transporter ATP-binding protein [Aquibacillus sediminis]